MTDAAAPYLTLHVPPDEMVRYIQELMTLPQEEIAAGSAMTLARRQWGGDTPLARAALLRWGALNLAFQDKRLDTWTAEGVEGGLIRFYHEIARGWGSCSRGRTG